jgi:hypothetical protein
MSNLDKNEELKKAFDELLNSTTSLKRKKKNNTERKKEMFLKVINLCESVITREVLLAADFKIHLDTYNEDFYIIMDSLLLLYLGKEGFELVSFYLYDRINPDGTINYLMDQDNNEVVLETSEDLFNLLCKVNPTLFD